MIEETTVCPLCSYCFLQGKKDVCIIRHYIYTKGAYNTMHNIMIIHDYCLRRIPFFCVVIATRPVTTPTLVPSYCPTITQGTLFAILWYS